MRLNEIAAEVHRRMCEDDRFGYSWEERYGAIWETWTIDGKDYRIRVGDYDCSSSTITTWAVALQHTPWEGALDGAITTLRQRGFDRVGIYGISKGGELALLAASLMPQITCVVAISPLACAMPGITGNKSLAGKGLSDRSSWTWRGEPVPCARGGGRLPYLGIIRRIVTERQLDMRFVYERIVERAPKEAWIAVERINGPVLLASPSHDAMWPSDEACRIVEQCLAKHAHPFEITRRSYEYASHILVPMETPSLKLFRVERAHPEACRQSREDAFTQTLALLARW